MPLIVTDKPVRLRAIEREDLPTLRDWRNALMEAGVVRQHRYLNMLDQERWLEAVTSETTRDLMMLVGVQHGPSAWDTAGVVGLTHMDRARRRAEASVYLGPEHRGTGLSKAALAALLAYGFDTVGLHRIYAEIFQGNEASIRLFESAGFRPEGKLREHHFFGGRFVDSLMYGLLEDEWRATPGPGVP